MEGFLVIIIRLGQSAAHTQSQMRELDISSKQRVYEFTLYTASVATNPPSKRQDYVDIKCRRLSTSMHQVLSEGNTNIRWSFKSVCLQDKNFQPIFP